MPTKNRIGVDGKKLSDARIEAGMSLEDVAKALDDGCNRSSVSRWEQEKICPSEARITKLKVILGTGSFITMIPEDPGYERARYMRREYKAGRKTQVQLAKELGLQKWVVTRTINGYLWKE